MADTRTIELVDSTRVVVPDSLKLLTPYVLTEQLDWFEDEIRFLRIALAPGDTTLDIGANYGTYTLSMAQRVGPTGKVFAYEPASTTAGFLREGIGANGFANVTLSQSALSSHSGSAELALHENSELNALSHASAAGVAHETVKLTTLDDEARSHQWSKVDFVKLDAEGEEASIIQGGHEFFAKFSPLVQFEIVAPGSSRVDLAAAFAAIGFTAYRLIPGLNLLAPLDAKTPVDSYQLNVFCCKPDRAAMLGARGLLLDNELHMKSAGSRQRGQALATLTKSPSAYEWSASLVTNAYAGPLAAQWKRTCSNGSARMIEQALAYFAVSRDVERSALERFDALEASFSLMQGACARQPTPTRLATLTRVACALGARSTAIAALQKLLQHMQTQGAVDMSEPFVPACSRFESIALATTPFKWMLANALEAFELVSAFSSFYTGESARGRLETLHELSVQCPEFASPPMQRRLALLQARFPA